nr:MAG TPA: SAS-5-CC protein, coiled coil, trimer [Caudoviricetes sp.]
MALKDSAFVKVYNYNPFILAVGDKMLAPCYNYDEPTYESISVDQLQYINSNSNAVRNGLVRFDENEEDDIYAELGVDKLRIIKNEEIEDIILHPTQEKLQKLLDIVDPSVFDRVVTIHQGLISSGAYDISNRVTLAIEEREKEFRRNILTTNIELTKVEPKKVDAEVEEVKKQNADLQAQLNKMQEMMIQLLAAQNGTTTSAVDISSESEKKIDTTTTPKKKPGRPPKTTK